MKIKNKYILFLLLITCMILTATPLFASTIKINKTSVSINKGSTTTLKVTGTNKKVTWFSSNKSIVTVTQKGIVKGVKVGKATITAKVSGKIFRCNVTVKKAPIELSGYKGKKISDVRKKFPSWAHYTQRWMEYVSNHSDGVRFIGPNVDYYDPDNHHVTIINMQPNATKKYSIWGMQVGMSRASMLSTVKKKGWTIDIINPSNAGRAADEEIICFKKRSGWWLEVILKKGKTYMVTYSRAG